VKTSLATAVLALITAFPAAAPVPYDGVDQVARVEAAAGRQVLVMLRLPPPHFHAGSGYGGDYPDDSGRAARRHTALELARAHGLRLVDDWPMPVIGIDCFVMEQDGNQPADRLADALARDSRVVWAQPVQLFHGLDGGDPLYPVQPSAKYWHLAQLHMASTGRGVRIAVVDSGVDATHPDLAGQIALRENFVDAMPDAAEMHGTAVAGIIAARAGNGVGIAGTAPDARLLALRACWQARGGEAHCSSFTLGKAINFALLHDAKIVNLSLSGPPDRLLQALLDAAAARGSTVIGAADPRRTDGGFPASYPGVIAVAAQSAWHGAAATEVLLAPGVDIPTCAPGARWAFVSGSSYAAAHVAGLVALLAQLLPAATPERLRHAVVKTANVPALKPATPHHDVPAASIDACATIAQAAGACACLCPSAAATQASLSR
jgi:subtilisin family serine protease